jgi:hypothetical protein
MTSAESLILESTDVRRDAEAVFKRVFRSDFSQPGYAVLVLPVGTDSHELRRCMTALKGCLSELHTGQWGEPLEYLSLGRFDQQNSTKLHLDGAPERSFLMLGYEPTHVRSVFQIADFSRCACDLGLSPAEFMQQHNPMFGTGAEMLRGYVSTITDWREDSHRIVIINNSIAEPGTPGTTYGVLHGASIPVQDPKVSRIINSTMMAPACFVGSDPAMQVQEFVSVDKISGQILG